VTILLHPPDSWNGDDLHNFYDNVAMLVAICVQGLRELREAIQEFLIIDGMFGFVQIGSHLTLRM
jgi:hypothetical protein